MNFEGYQIAHYVLMRQIRAGGMGLIYHARDTHLQRYVAVKIIVIDEADFTDAEAAKKAEQLFLREIWTIARFDDKHILPIYDAGKETIDGETIMYMVMPFRNEGSLADWWQHRKHEQPLPPRDVAHIVEQAAAALQHAHDKGIIHQDVKPGNFLVRRRVEQADQLSLELADFGIAKLLHTTSQTRTIRGTLRYMAPEQWEGRAVPATDQYALAIMAYELLTGRPPFTGQTMQSLWYQHTYADPPPPSRLNHALPRSLDAVLLRALDKSPEQRHSSIADFADAINHALHLPGSAITREIHYHDEEDTILQRPIPKTVNVSLSSDNYVSHIHDYQTRGSGSPFLKFVLALLLIASCISGIFYLQTHGLLASLFNSGAPSSAPTVANHTSPNLAATAHAQQTTTAQKTATAMHNGSATAISATATATASVPPPTATTLVEAPSSSYPGDTSSTPVFSDSLSAANANYNWDSGSLVGGNGSCGFSNSAYHAIATVKGAIIPCFAQATGFTNFFYQVKMTVVQGDRGGITFRANTGYGNFYFFSIAVDGSFTIESCSGYSSCSVLHQGSDPSINTGQGQTNLIGVSAKENTLVFYVNKTSIFTIQDSTFTQGAIGVAAEDTVNTTDVAFTNAQVWSA